MTRFLSLVCAIVLVAGCASTPPAPLPDINLGTISPSYDGVRYSAYPNGDKPDPGCSTPSGWTEAALGNGFGEICDDSGDFAMNGGGTNSTTNFLMVYKDAGSGDVQFICEFVDPYTGATDPLASVGCGLKEAVTATGYLAQCHSAANGSTVLEFKYGSTNPFTTVAGAAGQSRPRYCAITYDKSETEVRAYASGDGVSWTEIGRTTNAFAGNPYAFAHVQSKSSTEALQATIQGPTLGSAITVYTPTTGGSEPVLLSNISSQSATQNSAFSLDCNANWSGATSYTFSGLPTGITHPVSTLCAISGTPTGTGTSSVTLTAHNASGDTVTSFSIVVSAVSGDVFTIPDVGDTTSSTFNCATTGGANGATWASIRTSGSGTTPGAGDTIQITGGARGPTTFQNCTGTFASPVTIKNRTSDAAPVTIQYAGAGSFALRLTSSTNVVIDGSGKYSGAASGTLGVTSGTHVEGRTQAGIVITKTGGTQPTHYFRMDGTSCFDSNSAPGLCLIKGVTINAVANSGGTGICFSLNDHNVKAAANPGFYRSITLQNNYGKFCGAEGEGMYIGPNQGELDVPLRDISFLNNLIEDSGRECINVKNVMDGTNVMTDNHCYRSGLPQAGTQNDGLNINTAASWTVARNIVVGPGGNCYQLTYQNTSGQDTASPPGLVNFENNFAIACGQNTGTFYGFGVLKGSTPSALTLTIRNNTVVGSTDGVIDGASGTGCAAVNNIFASSGTNTPTNCTDTNNRKGTATAQDFVTNNTASGSAGTTPPGDFHLTAASGACSGANTNTPSDDYDGNARPTGGGREQGADESASCP